MIKGDTLCVMTRPMKDRRLQHTRVSSKKSHRCGACRFYLQIRGSSTFDKNRLNTELWKRTIHIWLYKSVEFKTARKGKIVNLSITHKHTKCLHTNTLSV